MWLGNNTGKLNANCYSNNTCDYNSLVCIENRCLNRERVRDQLEGKSTKHKGPQETVCGESCSSGTPPESTP